MEIKFRAAQVLTWEKLDNFLVLEFRKKKEKFCESKILKFVSVKRFFSQLKLLKNQTIDGWVKLFKPQNSDFLPCFKMQLVLDEDVMQFYPTFDVSKWLQYFQTAVLSVEVPVVVNLCARDEFWIIEKSNWFEFYLFHYTCASLCCYITVFDFFPDSFTTPSNSYFLSKERRECPRLKPGTFGCVYAKVLIKISREWNIKAFLVYKCRRNKWVLYTFYQ